MSGTRGATGLFFRVAAFIVRDSTQLPKAGQLPAFTVDVVPFISSRNVSLFNSVRASKVVRNTPEFIAGDFGLTTHRRMDVAVEF